VKVWVIMDLNLFLKNEGNMSIFEDERFKSLLVRLKEVLYVHHFKSHYIIKLEGVSLENQLFNILKAIDGYDPYDWKPNGRSVVEDMKERTTFDRISCKGGQFVYSGRGKNKQRVSLKITGSRCSSYKTHEERKGFLSENTSDWYFCLATDSKGFNIKSNFYKYTLCIFESKNIKPNDSSFIWNEPVLGADQDKIARTAVHKKDKNFKHRIGTSSTSYQLVSNIPFSKMAYTYELDIVK
tara:strand:+ start:1478 stop:2194 length:717 start_codon:yes stop_codon:yes gene_type:complete